MSLYDIVYFNKVKTNGLKDFVKYYELKNENYNGIIPLESYINLGKYILEQNDDDAISAETYISLGNYMSELSQSTNKENIY